MDTREQLESLRQLDLTQLPPEAAQQAWNLLLSLCSQLLADQEALRSALEATRAELESTRAELAAERAARAAERAPRAPKPPRPRDRDLPPRGERRRPGKDGGSKPPPAPPGGSPPSRPEHRSSETERREAEGRKPWSKAVKNALLEIDVTRVLCGEPGTLPEGAVFERYEDVLVQDLLLLRQNTRFRRARYRLADGGSYLVPLPPGYHGQFGPGVRALALSLNYGANVSMPLLHRFFQQVGLRISRGQVCRLVTERLDQLGAEAVAAIRAAVTHQPWLQIDDTRSGVRTEHGCCHVLGNELATLYVTTDRGDRRSVLAALCLGNPLTYRLDLRAFGAMANWDVAQYVRERLALLADTAPTAAPEFARWLDLHFPLLSSETRERVLTAAALAGYHAQTEVPIPQALLSDDAAVFRGLIDEHALCWIHDFRHYLELVPERPLHQRQFRLFKARYWKLYRRLLQYREAPTTREARALEAAFDRLVHAEKAPPFLAACIARTRKNKQKLLLVLQHPDLPLHNNARELDVRRRVRKRDVSFGPVSAAGRQAWDTLQSLGATLEKLGVSLWSFLHDRVHEIGAIPPLPELIAQKAGQLTHLNSWTAT